MVSVASYFLAAGVTLAADRPNFVIFMTDDQRHDAMSCAGNKILKTPNMDRLAGEGLRFQNMFVTNALCAPSRATILTGTYSHINGVIDNKGRRIRADLKIFPELLRDAGYETAFCGKSHVEGNLRNYKWDYYFGFKGQGNYLKPVIAAGTDGKDTPYQGYMDDVVTDHAIKWLEGRGKKPFCLLLWFKAPHRSWQRAPRHMDLFKDAVIPKPPTWDEAEKGCPGKLRAFAEADNEDPQEYELYDLEKDPGELNNLYGKPEHEDLVKKLRARMEELRKELADPELSGGTAG